MKKNAFSIMELIVVIAVVMILAAAALGESGGIVRSMRFNNAFNKIVMMTQAARNSALSGKNEDVDFYRVSFDVNKGEIMRSSQFSQINAIETLALGDSSLNLIVCDNDTDKSATIDFSNGGDAIILKCGETPQDSLKIELQEKDSNGKVTRLKSFSINKQVGVPQIE